MKAVVSPALALKLTSFNTYSSAPGYLNETFLNSISPFFSTLNLTGFSISFIAMSVFNTYDTRPAETNAIGKITDKIEIIKNAIIICITYCINAIISPTCINPESTL